MLNGETSAHEAKMKEILGYHGPISDPIISEFSDFVRSCVEQEKASRKVYAILIELLQNASFYSLASLRIRGQKDYGVGSFSISHDANAYYIECTNLVSAHAASRLDASVRLINSLDHQGLRRYKREKRDTPREDTSDSKGAGIGLIQVAILSENPIHTSFTPHEEDAFFYSTKVRVNKSIEEQE